MGSTRQVRFSGTVSSGHKQDAVEVPFDPVQRWGSAPRHIAARRLGHAVVGTIQEVAFRSHVVARSKRFWLLIEPETEAAANVRSGDGVAVDLHPEPSPS